MVTYKKLQYDSSKVQVESAIRDGNGVKIDTNYARKAIILSNTQVTFSSNPDTSTNTDYPYRGTISATGVTSSTPVDVTFADEEANSLHYASWCTTDTDVIYLYSTVNDTITIPTIAIGMDYTGSPVDSSPTSGSVNPVSSGGVYTALQGKQASGNYLTSSQTRNVTVSSSAPTSSDGSNGDIWIQY